MPDAALSSKSEASRRAAGAVPQTGQPGLQRTRVARLPPSLGVTSATVPVVQSKTLESLAELPADLDGDGYPDVVASDFIGQAVFGNAAGTGSSQSLRGGYWQLPDWQVAPGVQQGGPPAVQT